VINTAVTKADKWCSAVCVEHLHALHCIPIRHVSASAPVWPNTAAAGPALPGCKQGLQKPRYL